MMEQNWPSLIPAILLPIAILHHFPTKATVNQLLELVLF